VEKLFRLKPLTRRDREANDLIHLLSLQIPRTDAPVTLPDPPDSGFRCEDDWEDKFDDVGPPPLPSFGPDKSGPIEPTLRGFVHFAFLEDYRLTPRPARPALVRKFMKIDNRADALRYIQEVKHKTRGRKRRNKMRKQFDARVSKVPQEA
jgi:hypothetical protein